MQKSGEKLRNLSLCLDGTLAGRERVYPRLSVRACIRPSSQRDLRTTRDHSDDSSDLRRPLSSALQREERRADQLCAAFQAIGPVVSEIAERLRRTEEGRRMVEELELARETIADLTKDVEQLNAEVKLLCDRNENITNSLQILAKETEIALKAQESRLISLSDAFATLETRLNSTKTRLTSGLSNTLAELIEVEAGLQAKNAEEQRLTEENARLQAVLRLTEDFSNSELSRLIVENQKLKETNTDLTVKNMTLCGEMDDLKAELGKMKEFSAIETERLEQELVANVQKYAQMTAQIQTLTSEIANLRAKNTEIAASDQLQSTKEDQLTLEIYKLREKIKDLQDLCTAYEDQVRAEVFRQRNRLFRSKKALAMRATAGHKQEEAEEEKEQKGKDENRLQEEVAENWTQLRAEIQEIALSLGSPESDSMWESWTFLRTSLLHMKEGQVAASNYPSSLLSNGEKALQKQTISLRPVALAAACLLIHGSGPLAEYILRNTDLRGKIEEGRSDFQVKGSD